MCGGSGMRAGLERPAVAGPRASRHHRACRAARAHLGGGRAHARPDGCLQGLPPAAHVRHPGAARLGKLQRRVRQRPSAGPHRQGAPRRGDLAYSNTLLPHGLHAREATAFGTGPAERPRTAEECRNAAVTQAVTEVDPVDMAPGDAFCVITDEDNVAWLRLVSKDGPWGRLVFELVVWRRS
jgi:hypothetical protein